MKINWDDVQLTREGYFKLFYQVRGTGRGIKQSYDFIDEKCSEMGCTSCYSSFESFKAAYYEKERKKVK